MVTSSARRERALSPLEAVVLGLVQGVTEFLPISSSAHLILTSWLLGWRDQGLAFDMAANGGSLAAVLVYFRTDLRRLGAAWAGSLRGRSGAAAADARLAWWILVATLPVAVAGLLAQDLVATVARNARLIATTSIVFGLLLGWADRGARRDRPLAALGTLGALAIGAAQMLALVPGSSRSGVTITAALLLGLSREDAARFSFLLAVPVGLLVAAKQVLDLAAAGAGTAGWSALALGWLVSGLAAYAAIGWLLAWVRSRSLALFVVYRVVLGVAILAIALR